jgi:beta-lactamase superfamily II metal-dependent hydrolase
MKVNLHFECVGEGDCLLLNLSKDKTTYNVLIDCGKYNTQIEGLLKHYNIDNFNKVIVTHIDNDHIYGLIELLNANSELRIDDFWFNCYRHLPEQEEIPLTPFQRARVEMLYSELPSRYEKLDEKISAANALTLAETINTKTHWKGNWNKQVISTDLIKKFDLGEFGNITILSPTNKELEELEEIYKIEFCKKLYGKSNYKEIEKSGEIYELLLRILTEEEKSDKEEEYLISAKSILTKQNIIDFAKQEIKIDNSPTNRSSIAFIWEFNNHQILFLGDSAPDVILKQIRQFKLDNCIEKEVLIFDAIKISHHGSSRNITNELLEEIDSENFIFSGYSTKRPDEITISKIISKPVSEKISKRMLLFNCENGIVKNFRLNNVLKDEFHYEIQIASKIDWEW